MDAEVSTHTFLTMIIEESVCFMSCEPFFLCEYFHLICHLILTKINCITLKIRSKADCKSKSQNIWQQIILFSRTVMQMICAWPKIWILSFTKLFMHVSSRNMFPTIRNLQIRVHVYRPRHCCGDWLTFGCFVPMIADHIHSNF
jgi:hypothetical protein